MSIRALASLLADSVVFRGARKKWQANARDWNLPLSKMEKLLVGSYLILSDFADRRFPPVFTDREKTFNAEIAYRTGLPGCTCEAIAEAELRKPFWGASAAKKYLRDFIRMLQVLEGHGVLPPQRLLELGCGTGWLAECLALSRYEVTATSLSTFDIRDAAQRGASIRQKGLQTSLVFRVAPMETVADVLGSPPATWDAVLVYEALHHAFDWRQALASAHRCLRPGGLLLIANEPNRLHVFIAYRVAKLTNTHEIGFSRGELVAELGRLGFSSIRSVRNRHSFGIKPHWIVARK